MTTVLQQDDEANSIAMRERIARRAYDLFLARGAEHGHHLDDWLRAETEIAKDSKSDPNGERARETDAVNRTALQSSDNANPDESGEGHNPSQKARPTRSSA